MRKALKFLTSRFFFLTFILLLQIAIIALIGAACISALVTMFIMGYQKKEFAVGWKDHNLFNWEWYCEESN